MERGLVTQVVLSFLSFCAFFCRSTRLRAVKSTKRESSSSSWLTWSRTTDGSDAPAALLSFSDLGMLSLSNCVEHRPPCPPRTSPHPLLQLLPYRNPPQNLHAALHVHTPTGSSWNRIEQMTSTATTRNWSNCWEITSQESCRYFRDCVFSFAARELLGLTPPRSLSQPLHPLLHRTTLTSDCGDMATTKRREKDFTERTCLCFLYFRPYSETNDFDDFCYFNVICYVILLVLTSGFGKVLVLMADGCYWLAFLFPCRVCHILVCLFFGLLYLCP